jgi:hypothetical protein
MGTADKAFDTGQLVLAVSAAAAKSSGLTFSTTPATVRRISVIPTPGWKSTSTAVSSVVAGVPALANPLDNAIEKHDAWAAAINSSGLVTPWGSSERAGQLTGKVPIPDEAKVVSPDPSSKVPVQVVVARRVVAMSPPRSVVLLF